MITTVTTTTTAANMIGVTSLTLLIVLALLAFLVQKEIFGSLTGERSRRLARVLNVAIIPLAIVFVGSLVVNALGTLR